MQSKANTGVYILNLKYNQKLIYGQKFSVIECNLKLTKYYKSQIQAKSNLWRISRLAECNLELTKYYKSQIRAKRCRPRVKLYELQNAI